MGGGDAAAADAEDKNIEIWKIKKLIKSLEAARGCDASLPAARPPARRASRARRRAGHRSPSPLNSSEPAVHPSSPRARVTRRNGTSMISLILPPKDQISRAAKMLADEFGTASNIKSRVNRLSVLSAITSTQQRLKLFTKVPPNGLKRAIPRLVAIELTARLHRPAVPLIDL